MGGRVLEGAQGAAGGDGLARVDRGFDREVCGAEDVGVSDGHHSSVGYGAGEADGACACRQDRSGGSRSQIYTSVAREPGLRRGIEPTQDSWVTVQRPAPSGWIRGAEGGRRGGVPRAVSPGDSVARVGVLSVASLGPLVVIVWDWVLLAARDGGVEAVVVSVSALVMTTLWVRTLDSRRGWGMGVVCGRRLCRGRGERCSVDYGARRERAVDEAS